jgi:hypothetical protein
MARDLNVGKYPPMILTGSCAILVGSMLFGLTGVEGVILVAGVFLAIGLAGAWMVDRRSRAAEVGSRAVLLREPEPIGNAADDANWAARAAG